MSGSRIEEQKTLLHMNSDAFKLAMENELSSWSLKARKAGTTSLLIGGGLYLAFLLGRKLFKSKKINPPKAGKNGEFVVVERKKDSFIVSLIKEQIALFLIAMAKEKLEILLKTLEKKFNTTQESSAIKQS